MALSIIALIDREILTMIKLSGKAILFFCSVITFVAVSFVSSSSFEEKGNSENGREIFYDTNLSPFGNSCSTCHGVITAESPHDTGISPYSNDCSNCHFSVKDISTIKIAESFVDFLEEHYRIFMIEDRPLSKQQLKDLIAYIESIQLKK